MNLRHPLICPEATFPARFWGRKLSYPSTNPSLEDAAGVTANASDAAAASSAGSFTRLTELFLSKVGNRLGG